MRNESALVEWLDSTTLVGFPKWIVPTPIDRMRIIAGNAGGIPLMVPRSLTRPTTDRVREAVFSSLGDRVIDAAVLDLYAGSGALGLEALSRGAERCSFVDHERQACDTIQSNLKKARLEKAGVEVICQQARAFLSRRYPLAGETGSQVIAGAIDRAHDLIFADPPYARGAEFEGEITALLSDRSLFAALKPNGVFVFESIAGVDLPLGDGSAWDLVRERRYGDTVVNFLKRRDCPQ